MNILGDTLEKIAFEKAGIIKPNIPVVIGEFIDETKTIFVDKAIACNAPIYFAQDEYEVSAIHSTTMQLNCSVTSKAHQVTENFSLDLNGIYQLKNLRTVLCAEALLMKQGFNINNEAEKYALAHVKKLTGLQGRWDVIAEHPTVVLDVAHNEDGMKQVLMQINSSMLNGQWSKIHVVIGMVKDKEVSKVLSLLPKDAHYYFTNAHIPRALVASELQLKASTWQLTGDCFDDVNDAIATAKKQAQPNDLVVVCGSVFLVGEVNVPQ
jgi:dihydrofolate synthase/folylpolyglutamate synthase